MTENIRQNILLVAAGTLAVFASVSALSTKGPSDVKANAIQPSEDISVRVIADDGTVLVFPDSEAKQERDGSITIKARSKRNL